MNLFKYKHQKKEELKIIENSDLKTKPIEEEKVIVKPNKLVEQLTKRKKVELAIRNDFNSKFIEGVNPYFDDDLIKNVQILENFLKSFFPELPSYLEEQENGNYKVSLRALIDARDFLRNELDITPDELKNRFANFEQDTLKYKGGYIFMPDGSIWKNNEPIFNPAQPGLNKIIAIDFAKLIISFEPGIHVPFSYLLGMTKEFTNYYSKKDFPNIETNDPEPGESKFDEGTKPDWICNPYDNPLYNELVVNNPLITNKKPDRTITTGLTLEELLKTVPIENTDKLLKDFVTSPKFHPDYNDEEVKGTSVCNLKDINYFKLMLLLLLGGGDYRKAPLPNIDSPYASINTKADFFLCERKSYQTGHAFMYSKKNKVGISFSVLQMTYMFLKPLFTLVNIPPLGIKIPFSFKLSKWNLDVKWKDVNIFPGLCIFGFLEHVIMMLQEWVSKEINKMFKCDMTYTTPIANDEGVGLDLKESSHPICANFNREFKVCEFEANDVATKAKSGFYFCTNPGNCKHYIPDEQLYKSNKKHSGLKEKDIYIEGSAVKVILNRIDEGENVDYKSRG